MPEPATDHPAEPDPTGPDPTTPEVEPEPPFSLEVLPPPFRRYVSASAAAARVPEVMVAIPLLAVAGATVGRGLTLDIGNGWRESPNLWVALIAPTGAGKSPALGWARAPLDALQAEITPRGYRNRAVAGDTGLEALAADLHHNPGLILLHDELASFLNVIAAEPGYLHRPGSSWRSLWSGQPLIVPTRRHGPKTASHPVLAICGGIQPHRWRDHARRPATGALERFIPVATSPAATPWNRQLALEPDPPDVEAITGYLRHYREIGTHLRLQVTPDPDAAAVWEGWFNSNLERTLAAPERLAGYMRKLPSQIARTALILHLLWEVDDPTQPIAEGTMRHAVTLGEHYERHIRLALGPIASETASDLPAPTLADRLLTLLAEQDPHEPWLTRTHIHTALNKPARHHLQHAIDHLTATARIETRTHRLPHAKRPVQTLRALP